MNAYSPVFDPEGKYLYFFTNQAFKPNYSDIDNTFIYANTDTDRSHFIEKRNSFIAGTEK